MRRDLFDTEADIGAWDWCDTAIGSGFVLFLIGCACGWW